LKTSFSLIRAIIRFERRESDIQHELNARGLTLEQAVSVQGLQRFSRGFELRLVLAILIPSYVAGVATAWLLMHMAN
jgi:hypothetical protein